MLLKDWALHNVLSFNADELRRIGDDINAEIVNHWYSIFYPHAGEMVQAGETLIVLSTKVYEGYIHNLDSLMDPEFMLEWKKAPTHTCFSCKRETVDLDGFARVEDNQWYCRSCFFSLPTS